MTASYQYDNLHAMNSKHKLTMAYEMVVMILPDMLIPN